MKKYLLLLAVFTLTVAGCNKCYNCTKKCGTCQKGLAVVAGCQGDSILGGVSIEAWKAYFESQGYTCAYNNDVQETCGADNKRELENKYYDCLSK